MKNILVGLATTGTIVLGNSLFTPTVSAVTITLDEINYEITTIEGTFNDNETLLRSQPWFGSFDLSREATSLVGGAFDFPNIIGPIFLTNITGPSFGYIFNSSTERPTTISFQGNFKESTNLFAIATEAEPVPEPLTILGTLIAGGIGVAMKKRRNQIN